MGKYVYWRDDLKKWEVKKYTPVGGYQYVGVFENYDEACYAQLMAQNGHHWQGMPQVIPEDAFGFTYCLTHKGTGRMYIGAKQMFFWKGPSGGYKCSDPSDIEFDPELWYGSDWRDYVSSSKVVKKIVEKEGPWTFDYEIIELHPNKLSLFKGELDLHIDRDVLYALDESGNYQYLNENIMGVEYRPTVPRDRILEARSKSVKEIRDYYLKPKVCENCGSVIPYGTDRCPSMPLFGDGECTG